MKWQRFRAFFAFAFFLPISHLNAQTLHANNPAILYIGDSISHGAFGHAVDAELRKLSKNVYTDAECGTTPTAFLPKSDDCTQAVAKTVCGYWEKSPGLEYSSEKENALYQKMHPHWDPSENPLSHRVPLLSEQLKRVKPKVTIIQLGTNIAVESNPKAYRQKIHDMMSAIKSSGSACIWIAPPDADSRTVTREKLAETDWIIRVEARAHDCVYEPALISTHMVKFKIDKTGKMSDGIHPSEGQALDWAKRINDSIIPQIKDML